MIRMDFAVAPLRKDHQLLRKKLELLEAVMQVAPEAQFALREMCFSLSRLLKAHIDREEEVLVPVFSRRASLGSDACFKEHRQQQLMIRHVNDLLLLGLRAPLAEAVASLSGLIEQLRSHMEYEEKEVFPEMDKVAGRISMSDRRASALVTEDMTVNHVLKIHPRARRVFEDFQVDCDADGLHCLDELYWRHGINVQAMIEVFNQPYAHSLRWPSAS